MRKFNVKTITGCGILIAMTVVLSRMLGVNLPIIKISFGFIPIVFAAMYYGPLYSTIISALADIIGTILFPAGAFNPAFTIVSALIGLCYGMWLYPGSPVNKFIMRKGKRIFRKSANSEGIAICITAFIAALFNSVVFSLIINPILIHFYYQASYIAIYPTRLIKSAIMIPLETFVIPVIRFQLIPRLRKANI